jgi:hypothetical protein
MLPERPRATLGIRVGLGSEYWARDELSVLLDLLGGNSDSFGVEYVLARFDEVAPFDFAVRGVSVRSEEVRGCVYDGLGW